MLADPNKLHYQRVYASRCALGLGWRKARALLCTNQYAQNMLRCESQPGCQCRGWCSDYCWENGDASVPRWKPSPLFSVINTATGMLSICSLYDQMLIAAGLSMSGLAYRLLLGKRRCERPKIEVLPSLLCDRHCNRQVPIVGIGTASSCKTILPSDC